MKYLTIFVMSMTVFVLAACTTGGTEPTVEPEATEPNTALETAVPAEEAYPAESESSAPVPEPAEPYPEPESNLEVEVDSAYPAEVDVSEVEPSTGDGYPVEAPRPGVPNDSTSIADQASQDLAARLNVDVSDVSVVSNEQVEWPDGSLGCPAPGFSYIQVITSGYDILLEVDGEQYNYHTDLDGNIVLCDENGKPVP